MALFSSSPELLVLSILLVVVVLGGLYIIKSTRSSSQNNPSSSVPRNWPVVGILPSVILNLHRLRDYVLEISSTVHTLKVGIATIRIFITSHPENLQHIFTTNQANYPKGEEFAEIFDVARGTLFTVDGELFRRSRANHQGVLSNPLLVGLMIKSCRDKVEEDLLPLMARLATTRAPVDMSDLMVRLVFDLNVMSVFGMDPARLSSLHHDRVPPPMGVADAMDTVMEVGFLRHIVPPSCWKAMRRLNIGQERRLSAAQAVLRNFAADMIAERRRMKKKGLLIQVGQEPVDVMSSYIDDPSYISNDDNLLQATLITYMIAGRDTVSTTLPWIFYNLSKHPHVVSAIRDELAPIVSRKAPSAAAVAPTTTTTMLLFEAEEVKPLVYLQAVLLETLRLYPPIPMVRKSVAAQDVMPTGDKVCAGDIVLVSLQSTGRMEAVWGPDSQEYRPERWLLKDGRLRHMPSHKFPAFVMGPRLCLGKDIAMALLKIIVASVVWNFDVDVLDGQVIRTKLSCLLQMKDGLKVMLNKRERSSM